MDKPVHGLETSTRQFELETSHLIETVVLLVVLHINPLLPQLAANVQSTHLSGRLSV